jgi:hypothetical protein
MPTETSFEPGFLIADVWLPIETGRPAAKYCNTLVDRGEASLFL